MKKVGIHQRLWSFDLFFSLIAGLFELLSITLSMLLLGKCVDSAIAGDLSGLFRNGLLAAGGIILHYLLGLATVKLSLRYQENVSSRMRYDFMAQLFSLHPSLFHKENPDYYINILTEDTDTILEPVHTIE